MTVFDILRGLKEADNDAQSICSQAINDYSPYIKSAQATDRLGYRKIVLIDFCRYTFHISLSIFSALQRKGIRDNGGIIDNILDERQLSYLNNALKSYFALQKNYACIEPSVLHFDLSISISLCKQMIHASLTPCLIDSNKHIILGFCMLMYSTRKQIGNALVKLPGLDYHFELRNDKWVQINNSHLTDMEKIIIGQSANGKSIANIAEALSVSIATIKTHRTNIFKKLGVNNITKAIQYVEDYNLI
jgi:DNA-binding response regulator